MVVLAEVGEAVAGTSGGSVEVRLSLYNVNDSTASIDATMTFNDFTSPGSARYVKAPRLMSLVFAAHQVH